MFVIIATNPRINHIGSVHGPYATRELAEKAIEDLNFPTPEDVIVRRLFPGYKEGDNKIEGALDR